MADDLSLLFRLRAENAQAKAVLADTRQAVAQLRQSFGPQLTQTVNVANKAFSQVDGTLQNFVAQRVPLVGAAFARVSEGLRSIGGESAKTQRATESVARSIQSIATQSGRSIPQVAAFLAKFVQLEGHAKRNEAAFKFFGGSVDLIGNKTAKFLPQLEEAGEALASVSAEAATTGSAIAAMSGPIGIAVLAIAAVVAALTALAAAAVVAGREVFNLTKHAADFQGRMFDLAQQTGLAVETLSALEVVARTTGGELGSITQAIVLFQRKLDDAQNPLSKTAELFRRFNIDTADTETSLRSAFNALAAMPEGFAQTNAAAELFGARGGKQVLAILKETNGDIDGTIERLREMGLLISGDAARAADKFNDDLVILELQLRALTAVAAEELIPAIGELIRAFGDLLEVVRPVVSILGSLAAFTIRPLASSLRGISLIVKALTFDFKGLAKAMKEAEEAKNIPALNVPGVSPVPLPGQPTPRQAATDTANQAEAVVAAVKRRVAETNQALDSLFQQGRRNIEQRAKEIIDGNKKILDAERDRIDADIALKQQEIKALDEAQEKRGEIVRRDTDDYRALTRDIQKLQQERLDKESQFNVESAAIRARAAKERADATRNQVDNETNIFVKEFDRQIAVIEAAIKQGSQVEEEGLTVIEQLEQARLDERIRGLERQREVGFLTLEEQAALNRQLGELNQEKDRLDDEQRARRLQRERDASQRTIDITIGTIETLVALEQIAGQRRVDTLRALADLRVLTEEEAAKKILQIQLDLIDDEIEATKSKLTAAGSIVDKDERIRIQADLNNQIKILTEERKTIEANGDREIDEGRRRDLENERRYAGELRRIRGRIRDVERETAREVINLMQIHFANRRDIIRARLRLDIDDETARHEQALETLNNLEQENRDSKKTAEERLEFEKEINLLREAEAERHRLAMEGIRAQGKKDEDEASPLGRIGLDTENLKEFAAVLENSIVPLAQILTNAFQQVADAIGQTVQNWVLLGETGPAVMRKILAQALASIAAEAAVNAIKELALGFATLFFNPAESAAHFTAAGLWAAIGGVSAVAGRAVAGDLFKQKSASAGGGRGTGSGGRDEARPIDLTRPQQEQTLHIFLHAEPGRRFNDAIVNGVVDNVRSNGPMRTVIKDVSES